MKSLLVPLKNQESFLETIALLHLNDLKIPPMKNWHMVKLRVGLGSNGWYTAVAVL